MTLRIVLPGGVAHRPGSLLRAEIHWSHDHVPLGGAVELGWTTQGKGDVDRRTLHRAELSELPRLGEPSPSPLRATDARAFELRLPAGPYSFSGALISLSWTLRANLTPDDEQVATEIVLSPTGVELRLAPE